MTQETKIVVDANLSVFMLAFQDAILNGWVLDGGEDNPQVGFYGYLYEASLVQKQESKPVIEQQKKSGRPKTSSEPKEEPEAPLVLL